MDTNCLVVNLFGVPGAAKALEQLIFSANSKWLA